MIRTVIVAEALVPPQIIDVSSIPGANLDVDTNTLTFSFSGMTRDSGIVVSKDSNLTVDVAGVGAIGDFRLKAGIIKGFLNTPLPSDQNLANINFTAIFDAVKTLDATSKQQVLDAVNFTQLFALAKNADQTTKHNVLYNINFKNLFSAVQSTDQETRQRIIGNMTSIIDIAATDVNKTAFKNSLITAMLVITGDLTSTQGSMLLSYMNATSTKTLTELFVDLDLKDIQVKNILRDIDYTTLFNAIMDLEPATISSIFDEINFTDLFQAVMDSSSATKALVYEDVLKVVATMEDSENITRADILNTIVFGEDNKANIFKVLNNLDGNPNNDSEVIMIATLTDVSNAGNSKIYTIRILP